MRILLHACCGPCTIYPLKILRAKGYDVTAYFYNPNIHPFREFERRIEAMEQVAQHFNLPVIWDGEYGLYKWLDNIGKDFNNPKRCQKCYSLRIENTAKLASQEGFDAFTSTLLYSKYQDHEGICNKSRDAAQRYNVDFFYYDFRKGWKEGIEESIAMGIYRQPYCGCIFSEYERYIKRAKRLQNRLEK